MKLSTEEKKSLRERVLDFERGEIAEALDEAGGSVTRAARALGLTHQGLSYMINHRHQELLTLRTPIGVRRKSIIGKTKRRKYNRRTIPGSG